MKNKRKPRLERTTDYDIFEMHPCNRNLKKKNILLDSMRRFGFMPSCAIHVRRNGSGKLRVIRGHHRLDCAQRLDLPVYYIIDDTPCDIFYLEGQSGQDWGLNDFTTARAKDGHRPCEEILDFQRTHGLCTGVSASLLAGENASGGNKTKAIKRGTFEIKDRKFADSVARITDTCRDAGIQFATSSNFSKAISMVIRVPEFSIRLFCSKIKRFGLRMNRRTSVDEYLEEIEDLYNHAARDNRLPLRFKAQELSRERQRTFGGKNK